MRFRIFVAAISLSLAAQANEGMWVPQQLPEIAGPLKSAGLEMSPEQLSNLTGDPMGAVVSLGGCTASFVSNQGLVATNHHCVYGAIQLNSTPERNLIVDGYNAAAMADELSAGPNARVYVMDQIVDVSEQIKAAAANAKTPLERYNAIEAAMKALTRDCESDASYRCRVYSFFGGVQYRMFRQLEIKDVRLVYAPPSSIGNYGGEIDNWMWPRHTGDFSFYRAYVDKDGKPAAYSQDNVPYVPKHWLKLAEQPLEAGDFVMVAGYPGSTQRYALRDEFEDVAQWQYPVVGAHLKKLVAMIESAGADEEVIKVKYANQIRGYQNAMKNWDGQLEGFARINASATKKADEDALLSWLKQQGKKAKPALDAHARLLAINAEARAERERNLYLNQISNMGLIGTARQLHRLSLERVKPDAERESGYQERDLPRIMGGLAQFERRFDVRMEKQLLAYWLKAYAGLPADQRVAAIDALLGDGSDASMQAALDALYKTELLSEEARGQWATRSAEQFAASQDPIIALALALKPVTDAMEDKGKQRGGEIAQLRPLFMQAMIDHKRSQGKSVYPDANGSLRITFGNVVGYEPKDGVAYTPFTALEGVTAKATGATPFDAPESLLNAAAKKDYGQYMDQRLGSVPVNFLSNLDITGGNSGSPVLDARGQLVGLAFDGNWESVSSNWVFDAKMTRMISVDSRYMLWIMSKIYPAPNLLQEMQSK